MTKATRTSKLARLKKFREKFPGTKEAPDRNEKLLNFAKARGSALARDL